MTPEVLAVLWLLWLRDLRAIRRLAMRAAGFRRRRAAARARREEHANSYHGDTSTDLLTSSVLWLLWAKRAKKRMQKRRWYRSAKGRAARAVAVKRYKARHPEKGLARNRRRYHSREEVRQRTIIRARAWALAHSERVKEHQRKYYEAQNPTVEITRLLKDIQTAAEARGVYLW